MSTAVSHNSMPDDWLPVERRWFGFDKRTIPPALISIALIGIFIIVLPAIDNVIDYDRQIKAGDVVDLGAGVTFVPAVGWGFPEGLLVSQDSVGGLEDASHLGATVVNSGVTLTVTTGPFAGTPDELLSQVNALNQTYKTIDDSTYQGERVTATTSDGATGVAQGFMGVNVEGVIVAFVIDGIGIKFVLSGPIGALNEKSEAAYEMINSLTSNGLEEDQ